MNFVPLEDWYEELSDESLNPENLLIAEEDDDHIDVNASLSQTFGVKEMSTQTVANKPAFDVKSWLKTAFVLSSDTASQPVKVYPVPSWLTLKSGTICEANAFIVTAGVIKAARSVMDAISYTQRQYEVATENLLIQELRATRQTAEVHNFGPDITKVGIVLSSKGGAIDAKGFNPDGYEFQSAYDEAVVEVEKLEAVLANGERIIGDILTWVVDNAADLNLKVETGHTVKLGPIGNEIRSARYELLTPDTLLFGVQAQREFIRNARINNLPSE